MGAGASKVYGGQDLRKQRVVNDVQSGQCIKEDEDEIEALGYGQEDLI